MRGFRDLLDHLATLTGQVTTIGDHQVEKITIPTPAPRQAFDLLGVAQPITLAADPANLRSGAARTTGLHLLGWRNFGLDD